MKNIVRTAALLAGLYSTTAMAATERFTAIFGNTRVGHLIAETKGDRVTIDFNIKNNGRGPTIAETLTIGANGLPSAWAISGATTFGSKVDERFSQSASKATWADSTGKGSGKPGLYVSQSGSPWSLGLITRALLKSADGRVDALPGGTLQLTKGETLQVTGKGGSIAVTRYDIGGIDLTPETVLVDAAGELFASVTADSIIIREGYEDEQQRLRDLAAGWSTARFVTIQKDVAHNYGAPVRIRNVRIFDPATKALTALMAVTIAGKHITGIVPNDSPATPGEVGIDGGGGTLVPGMFEMHGHIDQEGALLDIAAGITTVRDMGNDNEVLDGLASRIEAGTIAGPRILRSGFIEGKSPFSANNGFVVDSEAKALEAVRWYAARGFPQIKIYNSMNPAWVPAMVAEAHRLGMRVAGHVPAFSNGDAMIKAGYDEMTHINQFMLQWVLTPEEDTRSLLRLTALKRLQTLDLDSPRVLASIGLMAERKLAIDPTIGIHEQLTKNRDGQVPVGAVDYLSNMPISYQRGAKKAWTDTSAPGDDAAYRAAYDKIVATVGMLHRRGAFIVPGTDTGGSFTYHRELELLQVATGMTPAEVLARATHDMARYTGQDQTLGSISRGKLADFFLVPGDPTKDLKAIKSIAMVVKDGTVYYPAEIYPRFGIKPFASAPKVTLAK